MTVRELLVRISSKELAEWMAFYKLEPFGEERADIRAAIVACTMANLWRGKSQPAHRLEDFMPKFEPPPQMDWQEIKDKLKGLMGL